MSSQRATGWLLIAGPVLTFLVWAVLWQGLIGAQETPADSITEQLANPQLARILGLIGSLAFVGTFFGLALLALSMQGDDKPGGTYAGLAALSFAAITAAAVVGVGLSSGALDAAEQNVADGVAIETISDALFNGVFIFWAVGNLLLGTAIVMQKNLHAVMAWLLVGFGVFMLATTVLDPAVVPEAAEIFLWAGLSALTAAAGVLTLRAK